MIVCARGLLLVLVLVVQTVGRDTLRQLDT